MYALLPAPFAAVAFMRRSGFVEHEGHFFERTRHKGLPCVRIWNGLYIFCADVGDMEEAMDWVSRQPMRNRA